MSIYQVELQVHNCKTQATYVTKFCTAEQAITFIEARKSTHAFVLVAEIEERTGDDVTPDESAVWAYLNPSCEHGLSLSLCYGPNHYPTDQQMGYGW